MSYNNIIKTPYALKKGCCMIKFRSNSSEFDKSRNKNRIFTTQYSDFSSSTIFNNAPRTKEIATLGIQQKKSLRASILKHFRKTINEQKSDVENTKQRKPKTKLTKKQQPSESLLIRKKTKQPKRISFCSKDNGFMEFVKPKKLLDRNNSIHYCEIKKRNNHPICGIKKKLKTYPNQPSQIGQFSPWQLQQFRDFYD